MAHVWVRLSLEVQFHCRAVRYDNIYGEIKILSFHTMFYRFYRGVAKYIVSGNTFSSFEWLIFIRRPRDVKDRLTQVENDQPGHNEKLVPKWRTTSVAWSCVLNMQI